MGTEFIALAASAAFLAYSILAAREVGVMVAVLSYAAVVSWIIQHDMGLLMAALGVAIVLGLVGLAIVLYREAASQDDTCRHASRKLRANNRAAVENIGS